MVIKKFCTFSWTYCRENRLIDKKTEKQTDIKTERQKDRIKKCCKAERHKDKTYRSKVTKAYRGKGVETVRQKDRKVKMNRENERT